MVSTTLKAQSLAQGAAYLRIQQGLSAGKPAAKQVRRFRDLFRQCGSGGTLQGAFLYTSFSGFHLFLRLRSFSVRPHKGRSRGKNGCSGRKVIQNGTPKLEVGIA